jgi:hypothetical protein
MLPCFFTFLVVLCCSLHICEDRDLFWIYMEHFSIPSTAQKWTLSNKTNQIQKYNKNHHTNNHKKEGSKTNME